MHMHGAEGEIQQQDSIYKMLVLRQNRVLKAFTLDKSLSV